MATESITYYECFNSKLEEFLVDLSRTIPEFTDLKVLKNGVSLAKNLDPKMPLTMFNQHMTPDYEDKILKRDDNFFMHENYDEIVHDNGINIDFVPYLKEVWSKLSDEDKNAIWKYLHLFVLLSRRCRGSA
jgi:hypothetical protein